MLTNLRSLARRSGRRLALAATVAVVATSSLPRSAAAQDALSCSVDLFKPSQLASATILIQRAADAPEGEEGAKSLRDAMRLLQDDRRFSSNPIGLAYSRARIYILWLHQDNAKETMTAFELNSGRDRTTPIDIVQAADSLLTLVETQAPDCVKDVDRWRQSKPWNDRIGAAYRFIEANQLDSADHYTQAALRLDRRSPFIYNALAQIAARRGDAVALRTNLERAIALADRDTALVETTRQLRTQYAVSLQESGMSATDPAQRAELLGLAARTFVRIGREDPSAKDAPAFVSVSLDIAMLLQDTTLLREILAPMLEDPTPYQDLSLLIGAETSRMLNRADDAMALYRGALEKNPNIRDANYFLSFLSIEAKHPQDAMPLVERLLVIDPSNPDNVMMKILAVRQVAEAELDPTKRVALIREVEALTRQESAMPQQVRVTRFERRLVGALFSGEIENRSRAAKTYTLTVEFLDLEGNVLETLSVTTDSAAPNASVPFSLTATQPGIAAWRYAALR